MAWEYRYERLKPGRSSGILTTAAAAGVDVDQLNELGADGWELAGVLMYGVGYNQTAGIFKRQKR